MTTDHAALPALGDALRALTTYLDSTDITDETLKRLDADLRTTLRLVATARGTTAVNNCQQHPGGPIDPTDDNTCLLCRTLRFRARRPAAEDRASRPTSRRNP